MKFVKLALPLALLATLTLPLSASAQEDSAARELKRILDTYTDNMGGIAKLRLLKSIRLTGTLYDISEELNEEGVAEEVRSEGKKLTVIKKLPDLTLTKVVLGEITVIEAFDGENAWRKFENKTGSSRLDLLKGDDRMKVRRNAPMTSALLNTERLGAKLELLEDAQDKGRTCSRIKVQFIAGDSIVHWLDQEDYEDYKIEFFDVDGNLLRTVYPNKLQIYEGVTFAMEIKTVEGSGEVTLIEISDVEVNIGVLNLLFHPPSELSDELEKDA